MKVLFSTPKVRAKSSQDHWPDGKVRDVEAWFELQLHEGPPDPTTWEGGGRTIASWREDFKRLRDPRHIVFECHGADAVPGAVIPNEILDALPDDGRISFLWTVCDVRVMEATRGAAS